MVKVIIRSDNLRCVRYFSQHTKLAGFLKYALLNFRELKVRFKEMPLN